MSNQIFSATYSGVDVYELIIHSGSVMRRKDDGWVNATHILKAANFPKAKRTRILERDVQTAEHEKVQGGYGKYQGTWVPLERAKTIAKEFAVDDILGALLNLESTSGVNSPPPAPKHHHASKNSSIIPKDSSNSYSRRTPARKTASMPILKSKPTDPLSGPKKRGRPKRINAPVANPNQGVFVGKRAASSLRENDDSLEDTTEGNEDDEVQNNFLLRNISINDGLSSEIDENDNLNFMSSSSPSDFMSDTDLANALKSPNQRINQSARESLEKAISSHQNNIRSTSGDKWYDSNGEYVSRLLEYFMAPNDSSHSNSISSIPEFVLNPPKSINFDQVIDKDGHTLFHWACAMGNAAVIEVWIKLGANYRVINNAGETPLMRSVLFTNSYNQKTFPKLVDLLGETIFEVDSTNKTVLHHIANAATTKNRIPSAFYYMDILLARISAQSMERLSGFLNLQDNNGNTALHLCAKNANRKCIKLLLEYKARHNLKNNQGLIASDILLKNDKTPRIQQRYKLHLKNQREAAENLRKIEMQQQSNHTFAEPHVAEAAIEATHKVSAFLVESLSELSTAYDLELQRKESDVQEVEELLKNMNEDIKSTRLKTETHLGEKFTDSQIQKRLDLLENEVIRYGKLVRQNETKLKRLIERSQKKKLETSIPKYELEEKSHIHTYEGYSDYKKLHDVVTFTKLQLNRKRLINEIIKRQGEISNSLKMQKYKKLISAASDVRVEEVEGKLDELLTEIEHNI